MRLRATCCIQAPCGWRVMPAIWTRLVSMSMTKRAWPSPPTATPSMSPNGYRTLAAPFAKVTVPELDGRRGVGRRVGEATVPRAALRRREQILCDPAECAQILPPVRLLRTSARTRNPSASQAWPLLTDCSWNGEQHAEARISGTFKRHHCRGARGGPGCARRVRGLAGCPAAALPGHGVSG